jgi:hypothetical protein
VGGGQNMFNTLAYIGGRLNEENVLWGVGASILLNHYGLINKPNDIDILIALEDIEKADRILRNMGIKKDRKNVHGFATKYFYEYDIEGYELDVMAGLIINHSNGAFEYIFDESSITSFKEINGVKVPLSSLEDWYVIYQLIPNRDVKVKLIEDYLSSAGIKKPELLKRALTLKLPEEVSANIVRILNA